MKTIQVILDAGAVTPTRAHGSDAGIDIYSKSNGEAVYIAPHSSAVFDTGVHISLPYGYAGLLVSKSGLNVRRDITSEGLIDAGYTGSIVVKLYNNGDDLRIINPGEKISQLVIIPCETPAVDVVTAFTEGQASDRGANGFGSTGR